jgi:TolB-like protein
MKFLYYMVLGLCAFYNSWAQTSKLPAIAVLAFKGDQTVTPEQLEFITGKFAAELVATKQFTVLERGRMDFILQEQGFQQTGACNTSECQVQIGQLLGVDQMVAGNLVRFGTRYAFRAEYIDVGTGQILYTVEHAETGALEDVYENLCKVAAQKLAMAVSGKEPASPEPAPIAQASTPVATALPPPQIDSTSQTPVLKAMPHTDTKAKKGLSLKRKIGIALISMSAGAAGASVYFNEQVIERNENFEIAKANFYENPRPSTAQEWSAIDHEDEIDVRRDISAVSSGILGGIGILLMVWPEGN